MLHGPSKNSYTSTRPVTRLTRRKHANGGAQFAPVTALSTLGHTIIKLTAGRGGGTRRQTAAQAMDLPCECANTSGFYHCWLWCLESHHADARLVIIQAWSTPILAPYMHYTSPCYFIHAASLPEQSNRPKTDATAIVRFELNDML